MAGAICTPCCTPNLRLGLCHQLMGELSTLRSGFVFCDGHCDTGLYSTWRLPKDRGRRTPPEVVPCLREAKPASYQPAKQERDQSTNQPSNQPTI